jgi:DHA1 family bicyclomycin/chloramphenicol resistance-like MFS transporter
MTKQKYFFLILILGSLIALSPFSIDMYLPGFKAIAKDLNTTVERVTLSLSSYFIGLALGQLIYGPLLDKYGRKKPLYVGLSIYLIASIGCMMASSLNMLIILRFIQAIGGCAAGVASVAMVRDLFPVNESAKVFALLMLVLGASPMVAPTVGGYVTANFGWHAVFIILAGIATLIFILVVFALPDKYEPDHELSLKPVPIIKGFWSVFTVPQFFIYTLAGSVSFAGLFTYVAGSPVVFMKIYQVSTQTYGWIFAGLSIGFIGSSQINNLLIKKYRSEQIIPVVFVCQFIFGAVFLLASIFHWLNLPGTLVMIFLTLCCAGLSSPNTSALSIAPFSKNAGTASSLMGALQLGIGSLATMGVGAFDSISTIPLAAIMAGCGFGACLIYFVGMRLIKIPIQSAETGAINVH